MAHSYEDIVAATQGRIQGIMERAREFGANRFLRIVEESELFPNETISGFKDQFQSKRTEIKENIDGMKEGILSRIEEAGFDTSSIADKGIGSAIRFARENGIMSFDDLLTVRQDIREQRQVLKEFEDQLASQFEETLIQEIETSSDLDQEFDAGASQVAMAMSSETEQTEVLTEWSEPSPEALMEGNEITAQVLMETNEAPAEAIVGDVNTEFMEQKATVTSNMTNNLKESSSEANLIADGPQWKSALSQVQSEAIEVYKMIASPEQLANLSIEEKQDMFEHISTLTSKISSISEMEGATEASKLIDALTTDLSAFGKNLESELSPVAEKATELESTKVAEATEATEVAEVEMQTADLSMGTTEIPDQPKAPEVVTLSREDQIAAIKSTIINALDVTENDGLIDLVNKLDFSSAVDEESTESTTTVSSSTTSSTTETISMSNDSTDISSSMDQQQGESEQAENEEQWNNYSSCTYAS